MHRAVFFDRDGTLIEDVPYLNDPTRVKVLPGVAESLRLLRQLGYLIFVISNQSGIGRGLISQMQFEHVQSRFLELLLGENLNFDGYLYCYHTPEDDCMCRKPKTGLIPRSWASKPIDWTQCYTVGDKRCDVELGLAMGGKGHLVETGQGLQTVRDWNPRPTGVRVFKDVFEFTQFVAKA